MARARLIPSVVLVLLVGGCSESSRPTTPGPTPAGPLKVNAVSPNTGSPTASTPIQIIGTGFVNGSTLALDGVSTPVTYVNATALRATAPPHPAGPIDIVVRNPDGESSELKGGFRYAVALSGLSLSGNLSLQSVGETTRLTATALYADGTTTDVTSEARWTVAVPSVASIATDGVLTARALGTTTINLQYPVSGAQLFRSGTLVVTPPGTRAVWGRIRLPGEGGILDATVAHRDSGQSTQTNNSGYFSLGGLTGRIRFYVTKPNFEDVEAEAGDEAFVDIPMQRVVRLEAGGPQYSGTLAPNDMDYDIAETHCQPCRMLRITSPRSGTANVTLRWTTTASLSIWSDGRRTDAEGPAREIVVPLQVGTGETLIFVGRMTSQLGAGQYVPITVSVAGVQ